MRILLTGGTGQVGYALRSQLAELGEVWSPTRLELDLSRPTDIVERVRRFAPDLIVNPAAYTKVDAAESNVAIARAINSNAPRILAQEANRLGIPLIHYSTDYVFSGNATTPYSESDDTAPQNVYGTTKLRGEEAVLQAHSKHIILRTSWVHSPIGRNFVTTMLGLFKNMAEIRVVDDQIGTPTSAQFLARSTLEIARNVLCDDRDSARWGIYHLTMSGQTTWYEFACELLERFRYRSEVITERIIPVSSSEYPAPARRPVYSVLSSDKIQRVFHLKRPNWRCF